VVGFYAGSGGFPKPGRALHPGYKDGLTPLAISPRQRLDDAVRTVSDLPFGGTDCALPMLYAQATEREVDTFVTYTDSETWAGDIHAVDALLDYRRRRASTRGWSWSAWSRTASRSPIRPIRGCSTSWASTPRRRS